LRGSVHRNRHELKDFGVRVFQRKARELYGISFSPGEIKVRFEAEQPALESSRYVTADYLEMTYRGKRVWSKEYPTETIPYDRGTDYDPELELEESQER
jgi:hypothetical protein